jgi:hypothetical protein
MKKLFWVVLVLGFAGSCIDEPDCIDTSNAFIGISFKKMFDGKNDTVAFNGIQTLFSDSIFYPYTLATAVELPLNQFETQTEYLFDGVYAQNFLLMNYETAPVEIISEDCGNRYVISKLDFADHDFDSVKIISSALTGEVQTNLEVYRCPRTNLAKVAFRQLLNAQEKADTMFLTALSADYPATFFVPNDTLSFVNLPLNPTSSATTFYFDFKDGSSQSITFSYTRTDWDQFETACGSLTLFSTLSSVASDFNEVRITKDSIQDPPITNVAIFK